MIQIQKIVNEIHNDAELMECFESVTAIDDETILFIGMKEQPGRITKIIKDNGCKIKEEKDYTIINGETYNKYYWRCIHEWVNDRMPKDLLRWSEEGRKERERLEKQFFKENNMICNIRVIKIKKYSINIEKIKKQWEEECEDDMTVEKLIKELEKLDKNTLVYGMDNEYGEYQISHISSIHTYRNCPDCHECGCVRCDSRKMFERKYVVLE